MRNPLTLTAAGLAGLLAASCSMPSREQWSQINQRGLLPVLIDGRDSTAVAVNTGAKPSEERAVRVQAVTSPVIVKTPVASPISGRPGYVFSPHTAPGKPVDVRGHQPGEEVRCPYTGLAFLVPSATPAPSREVARISAPRERHVVEVVSNTDAVPPVDPVLNRLEPEPATQPSLEPAHSVAETSPAPAAVAPAPNPAPPKTAVAAKAKADIPYGLRVAGRPGFVYSPFASRTQLVDVAGTAPGVVVKCPYTNKHFRVPELVGEEVKPSSAEPSATPPTTAETPPAPEKPAATPAPAPSGSPAGGSLGSPQQR